jgi:hypothetical protein
MKKTLVPPEAYNKVLSDLTGSEVKAQVWSYHVSLGRLTIRLYRDTTMNTWIIAAGCREIATRFRWTSPNLVIRSTNDGDGAFLEDINSGFRLECDSISIAYGPPDDSDMSPYGVLGE